VDKKELSIRARDNILYIIWNFVIGHGAPPIFHWRLDCESIILYLDPDPYPGLGQPEGDEFPGVPAGVISPGLSSNKSPQVMALDRQKRERFFWNRAKRSLISPDDQLRKGLV
jgi:hypothetical protein